MAAACRCAITEEGISNCARLELIGGSLIKPVSGTKAVRQQRGQRGRPLRRTCPQRPSLAAGYRAWGWLGRAGAEERKTY